MMRRSWDVRDGDTVTSRPAGDRCDQRRISDRQAKGQVFMPMHFREAAANLLTNPSSIRTPRSQHSR